MAEKGMSNLKAELSEQGARRDPSRSSPAPSTNTPENGSKPLTPQGYAKIVLVYSQLPSGIGQNHERLARFLSPPTDPYNNDRIAPITEDRFLTVYRLGNSRQPSRDGNAGPSSDAERITPEMKPIHFSNWKQFEDFSPPGPQDDRNQLLFLRGYPSREWLNLLGCKYHVDPEFFRRHFDFRSPTDGSNNFSTPSLPSASWHLIKLPMMTVGCRNMLAKKYRQSDIRHLRMEDTRDMENYLHKLNRGSEINTGDAVIRQFWTIDETHFAIEQRVSICIQRIGHNWATFIWLDSGRDLTGSPHGPWSWQRRLQQSSGMYLCPVIKQEPMIALKSHLVGSNAKAQNAQRKQPQNASKLHLDYGRSLRSNVMASDPFYALSEILEFAASSEQQTLNLLDTKLDKFLGDEHEQDFSSLPNLKYVKHLLYRHIQSINETLASIHNTKHPKLPKAIDDPGEKARVASEAIQQDFEHLLAFAQALHARCDQGISILMSTVSIAESEKAMRQAERLGKLTFLAFMFVPLSFTTSLFGMNFKEFGQGTLSIWAWFALSVPVLTSTLLLFFYDLGQIWADLAGKI